MAHVLAVLCGAVEAGARAGVRQVTAQAEVLEAVEDLLGLREGQDDHPVFADVHPYSYLMDAADVAFTEASVGATSTQIETEAGELLAGKANLDYCTTYEPDIAASVPLLMYGPALETLDYKMYKWPGHGVAEHLSYQFHEKEYMQADEYDHLISDPGRRRPPEGATGVRSGTVDLEIV